MFRILLGGENKTNGNVKPFAEAESHFVYARIFMDDDAPKVAQKISFKRQRKIFPHIVSRKKKANRKTHLLLSSKWIKSRYPYRVGTHSPEVHP